MGRWVWGEGGEGGGEGGHTKSQQSVETMQCERGGLRNENAPTERTIHNRGFHDHRPMEVDSFWLELVRQGGFR